MKTTAFSNFVDICVEIICKCMSFLCCKLGRKDPTFRTVKICLSSWGACRNRGYRTNSQKILIAIKVLNLVYTRESAIETFVFDWWRLGLAALNSNGFWGWKLCVSLDSDLHVHVVASFIRSLTAEICRWSTIILICIYRRVVVLYKKSNTQPNNRLL